MRKVRILRVVATAALALALSGCVKLDMNLAVKQDNTVDGTVVLALDKKLQGMAGGNLGNLLSSGTVTQPTQGHVSQQPYDDGSYVGTQMSFSGVPISQFQSGTNGNDLSITRVGDTFRVSGTLDMSSTTGTSGAAASPPPIDLSAFGAAPQLRVRLTFPGDVVSANGVVDGRTVTWTPKAGEKLDLRAVARATPGSSLGTWLLVGGLVAGLALMGGLLVVMMRRRPATATEVPPGSVLPGQPVGSAPEV
jgi:hypothetical protein